MTDTCLNCGDPLPVTYRRQDDLCNCCAAEIDLFLKGKLPTPEETEAAKAELRERHFAAMGGRWEG